MNISYINKRGDKMYTTRLYVSFEYLGNVEYETLPYKSSMLISVYARVNSGVVIDDTVFKKINEGIKHDISERYNIEVKDIPETDFVILFWGEVLYSG